MLVHTGAQPEYVIVDSFRHMPRFWSTVWSLQQDGYAVAANTLKTKLRHVNALYLFTDDRFGRDALDQAVSDHDTAAIRAMLETFYLELTSNPEYSTSDVQRWDTVRSFVHQLARLRITQSDRWSTLISALAALGRIRKPRAGRVRFLRALPASTLSDLLVVADPNSKRNPFHSMDMRWRNWLAVNLMLLCGLRRGEMLILAVDALKHGVDHESGELVYWLDITTCDDMGAWADARTTRPSMKTEQSHRQIPISTSMADLFMLYVGDYRRSSDEHGFLLTSRSGSPLSAEALRDMVDKLTLALTPDALKTFQERSGGKTKITPHDFRHTCATMRFRMFMRADESRELALQRMRAFFGWSVESTMPDLYARAAIEEDLHKMWNVSFDDRVNVLRSLTH